MSSEGELPVRLASGRAQVWVAHECKNPGATAPGQPGSANAPPKGAMIARPTWPGRDAVLALAMCFVSPTCRLGGFGTRIHLGKHGLSCKPSHCHSADGAKWKAWRGAFARVSAHHASFKLTPDFACGCIRLPGITKAIQIATEPATMTEDDFHTKRRQKPCGRLDSSASRAQAFTARRATSSWSRCSSTSAVNHGSNWVPAPAAR